MINSDTLKGKWKQMRGRIKQQWGRATGHNRIRITGKRNRWSGSAQEKYETAKTKTEQTINLLLKKAKIR